MFKRLGIFAVLAVCLFAITIVMVGCNGEDDEDTHEEKLAGVYDLVEMGGDFAVVAPPTVTGIFTLLSTGDWSMNIRWDDGSTLGNSGSSWSATETTLTTTDYDGITENTSYRWVGERLETSLSTTTGEILRIMWEE